MAKLYPIVLHAKPYSTLSIQMVTQVTCLLLLKSIKKSILIKPNFNPHSLLYPSIPIQIFKFIAPPSNRIKSIIYATICLEKFTL